ncbi:hypothetical protein SVAN01_07676 [Stagonosporopsis vannaccii]|nr:hypothetical protein SVAN01_07676 [Stagonosporopsis vannaccii]
MPQQPSPPFILRRWTPAEDDCLYQLRFIEQHPWSEIASALNRTTNVVTDHHHLLKATEMSSFKEWDAVKDAVKDGQIIDGHIRGLTSRKIGAEMGLPAAAVQGRWTKLLKQHKVPQDLLALSWRRKEVNWSNEDDEAILRAWKDGKDEEDIVQSMKFEGKGKGDTRERCKLLRREKGPVYSRVMDLDEVKAAPHALDWTLGRKSLLG